MKKFVINLKRRPDRKKQFLLNNPSLTDVHFVEAVDGQNITLDQLHSVGMDTDPTYINVWKNRRITKGEVGCFLSHYKVWQICADLDDPVMVFEDDAILKESKKLNDCKIRDILKEYGYVNMGRKENYPELVQLIDDELEIPYYAFNMHAYALTPKTAKILLSNFIEKNIIPVDEYLPKLTRIINAVSFSDPLFNQTTDQSVNSDIEPITEDAWFIDFKTHVITLGTDAKKCRQLMNSASKYGIEIKNLGLGQVWKGGDVTGPSGGMKINLLREHLKYLPNHDVVLFTDAYDVFFGRSLETIVNRYLGFNTRILFAAESTCWPRQELEQKFPESHTKYRFLNSGTFIGQVGELKALLNDSLLDNDDDQLYYQIKFLSKKYDIKLDYEGYIFQCHEPEVIIDGGFIYNPLTTCYPCIYHGNGGVDAKQKFESLYRDFQKQN